MDSSSIDQNEHRVAGHQVQRRSMLRAARATDDDLQIWREIDHAV